MGALNSSKTRVEPVFSRLFAQDQSGRSWLRRLVALGSSAPAVSIPGDLGALIPDKHPSWGDHERPLAPPKSLLKYLIKSISEKQVQTSGDATPTLEKRLQLVRNEEGIRDEALEKISRLDTTNRTPRAWYIFEGDSYPDACLQTDTAIVVVEGKRTEPMCTTKTKWMPNRSQLLRHMDAAFEAANGRSVYGLLIVEDSSRKTLTQWEQELDAQLTQDSVVASLPHRSDSERSRIVGGVLGVTSWQTVCSEFDIPFPPDSSK